MSKHNPHTAAGPDPTPAGAPLPWLPPGYGAPLLVVLSGPAGVGKTSVLRRMRDLRLPYHIGVTATTRAPGSDEVDGVDYHFVSRAAFERMLDAGELLEHAFVHARYWYGVPRQMVREALARGQDVIVPPEVQGAATIRQRVPGALLIFLAPPTFESLERHIRARRREPTEDEVQARLATARGELTRIDEFDYAVVNEEGRLDDAVEQIDTIIRAERRRLNRHPVVV